MWRRVRRSAVVAVVAVVTIYIVALVRLHVIAASSQHKANADVEAIAREFAREALTALRHGPVTTEWLRTINRQAGMISAHQSGDRVVITFQVVELYHGALAERCYSETIVLGGPDATANTSGLACARIPIPGPDATQTVG